MEPRQPSAEKALTARSAFVALLMVLVWTVGCCFMISHGAVMIQQMLILLGFGAILTVFLLQFPRLFLASIIGIWAGTLALMLYAAPPDERAAVLIGHLRAAVFVVPLIALAVWLAWRPLKRRELVVVYAAVVVAIPWCSSFKGLIQSSTANLFEAQRKSEPQAYAWARELPWWAPTVAPSGGDEAAGERATRRAVEAFARGNGGKVPWRLWWRPLVYWSAMGLAFQAMLMGLLLMFRKRWIEHERLPFVWAEPALHIIRGSDGGMSAKRRWVLFGIGAALCLPATIYVSPSGESLSSWACLPWAGNPSQIGIRGGVDLSDLNLLPGVSLRLFWGPMVLAAFLLFPADVLMTTALTYILLVLVLPGLMRSFGIAVGPEWMANFVKNALRFGGSVGLVFWSIWFNRRTIWGYVRSLWGGAPTDEPARDELPRRLILGLFVCGTVAFIAMGSSATSTIQMVLLTLLILIYCFAQVRLRAEGLPLTNDNNFGSHQMVGIQRDWLGSHYGLAANNPDLTITGHSWATHWMQWGFNGTLKSFGPHNMLLEAFKIGHELRVNARQIAKIIVVSMLLVTLLTPTLYVFLMHVYGYQNCYTGPLYLWHNYNQWTQRASSYGVHSSSQVFKIRGAASFYKMYENCFHLLYGFAFIGLLFYLRREYPRFPLSPIGVIIAAEHWSRPPFAASSVWFAYLLAWAAKALIFRWLGVRSFREKVQPAVILILCGMIFGIMLYVFRHVSLLQGCLK